MKYVNKTYLGEDGLIHQEYHGDQTAEKVKQDVRQPVMGSKIGFFNTEEKAVRWLKE